MMVEIQKIRSEDIGGYHSAVSSIANEKKYILTVDSPDLEQITHFVKKNIERGNAHYVALNKNLVVGWADIVPYTRQTIKHVGKLGMGVLPEYRGRGIGKMLLDRVIKHAWKQGLKRLELEVFSDNFVAVQLYEKFGFKTEGVKKYARLIDGNYQNITIMAQYSL